MDFRFGHRFQKGTTLSNTLQGSGEESPPPGLWLPVQQIPGWTVEYVQPLGQGISDTGTSWVAVNHAITGIDASLVMLQMKISATPGMMPENVPIRVTFVSFEDTCPVPGVDKIIDTAFSLQASNGNFNHFNSEPPTTSYADSPFINELIPHDEVEPATGKWFAVNFNEAAYSNSDVTGQMVNFEVMIEAQL